MRKDILPAWAKATGLVVAEAYVNNVGVAMNGQKWECSNGASGTFDALTAGHPIVKLDPVVSDHAGEQYSAVVLR